MSHDDIIITRAATVVATSVVRCRRGRRH